MVNNYEYKPNKFYVIDENAESGYSISTGELNTLFIIVVKS